MNSLFVLFCIFSMSLFGAFVIFKYLKNNAKVKLPLGQFGGAIAGFIAIFYILITAYHGLQPKEVMELKAPNGFESFVSQDNHFGFCYPKDLKLNSESYGFQVIKSITISNSNGNKNYLDILIGSLDPELTEKDYKKLPGKKELDLANEKLGALFGKDFKAISMSNVTVDGRPGNLYVLEKN